MKQMKLNTRGNVVFVSRYVRNLSKLCTTSISPSLKTTRGTRYVDFFFFSRLDFRFGPFGFFLVFDLIFDLIPDSASKNAKAVVSMMLR